MSFVRRRKQSLTVSPRGFGIQDYALPTCPEMTSGRTEVGYLALQASAHQALLSPTLQLTTAWQGNAAAMYPLYPSVFSALLWPRIRLLGLLWRKKAPRRRRFSTAVGGAAGTGTCRLSSLDLRGSAGPYSISSCDEHEGRV